MRRILVGLAALTLLGALTLGGFVVYVKYRGRDVRGSSTIEFVPPRPERGRPAGSTLAWRTYGFDDRRLRAVAVSALRPPLRRIWTFHGRSLLEFPPAVVGDRVYLPTFQGRFFALDAATGRAQWQYGSGRCSWGSPAVSGALVFETFLNRTHKCDNVAIDGEVVAFDAVTGHVRWRRVGAPTESSPLVAQGLVVVGDWSGRVFALDAATGARRWSHRTGGAVKSSAALAGGHVYIGSYDGHVYALALQSGRELWRASAQSRLGGRGAFYATPAVAYGRVYVGATDGKVYSFGARTGRIRWSRTTGGYVYASAAVWRGRVLVGSYDGSFYAFDAATGDTRWHFRANGPISGAATVVGRVVYFSTLRERTYALDAGTGRLLWTWPDGKYSPVVTDGRRVYLVGRGRLYGMVGA